MMDNLKPLSIGDWVTVCAVAEMVYDQDQQRGCFRQPCEPFRAQIVGLATRQTGQYKGGSGSFGVLNFESDYEEPSLRVTGTIRLWLVRAGLMNKEIGVHDSDLHAIGGAIGRTPLRRVGVPVLS